MNFFSINRKVLFLILLQVILIVVSVLILTIFESQNTLLGNSINVASNNLQLADKVLFEMEKYRIGTPFVGMPTLTLNNLNDNIRVLKEGGVIRGFEVLPLPKDFDLLWYELRDEYLHFASTSKQISTIKDSGKTISELDILHLEESKEKVLEKSMILSYEITKYTQERSQHLIFLQIFLAIINVIAHITLIILIISILKKELNSKLKIEKKLYKKEIEIKEEKEKKFSLLGKFAAIMAHDMRNPLSIIQMSLENMLILSSSNEQKSQQMKKIERAMNRITHQIDGVLDYVQEKPLRLSKVSLSEIFDDSVGAIIIPSRVELIFPKTNIELVCDREKFSALLYNLILNAVQSIIENGIVEIKVEEKEDKIILEIRDSGPGIPEKDLNKIFDPLFTTKQQGTGLGLASCKTIIKSHGGSLRVENNPTRFIITLPKPV